MSETLLRQDETPAPSCRSLDEGLAAAEAARSRGDSMAALPIFAELRERFPDHAAAYLRAAAMLSQLRRFEEAEQLLANGAARFREDPGFAIERGWLAYRRGHLDDAIERWREIREAMPGHPVGYTAGAIALRDAGRIAEAEKLLAEAIERFAKDPGPDRIRLDRSDCP
jgi:tetratricopeptide (TPR) repeat protein